MTDVNVQTREPTVLDYASPVQFRFKCSKLPKVEFFLSDCKHSWYRIR